MAIAKAIYEWIGEDRPPAAEIPRFGIEALRNSNDLKYTIRVDSKVVQDSDDLENAKSDETKWMRIARDMEWLLPNRSGSYAFAAAECWPIQWTHGRSFLTVFHSRSSAVQHSHPRDSASAR